MENQNEFEYGEVDQAFEQRVKHAVNLREREQIKSFLSTIETEFQAENATENVADKVVVRSMMGKRWMGIAAALMFLAAAFFTFQNFSGPSADQLVADFYEPYPNSYKPIVRSQMETDDMEVLGLVRYENELYKEALMYFNLLPEVNDDIRMFMAISKLEIDKFTGAKEDLNVLIDKNGRLSSTAQWYMGMAFMKEGALEKAKPYFDAVASQPTSPYQRDAKLIIEKLK